MVNKLFGLIVKVLLIAIIVYMGMTILAATLSCGLPGLLVIGLIGCGVWWYLQKEDEVSTKE